MKALYNFQVFVLFFFVALNGIAQTDGNLKMSKLVENNILLESDLYAEHLQTELSGIKIRKDDLLQKVRQGNKQAEIKVKELTIKEKNLNQDLKDAMGRTSFTLKIKPLPPCPPKQECRLEGLGALLVPKMIHKLKVQVFDKKNKVIGTLQPKPLMADNKTGAKLYGFKLKEKYTGPVTLKITRTNGNNSAQTYEVQRVIN